MARDDDDSGVSFDNCTAASETAKAVLVTGDALKANYEGGTVGLWVPKSVIHDDSEVFMKDDVGTLVVKTWWAEKVGLG